MNKYLYSFILPFSLAIPFSMLVVPLSMIYPLVEKYMFADWEYVKFLMIFVIIDTLTSWWYNIKNKSFSSIGYSLIFKKIIIYSILLILAHGLATHTIDGEILGPLKWCRTFICTALLIREAISIIENLNKIMPGIIPEKITSYFKDFENSDKLKEGHEINKEF